MEKSEEVNYKKNFCEKYFDKGTWDLDVLCQVDVHLKDKKGNSLLYIESKYKISSEALHKQALAQTILTNKKQESILSQVALIYQDANNNDVLELIDCSENSVMYNNDFNWQQEKASMPTKDAIDRINDRIKGKITQYINDEIKDFYSLLKKGEDTQINITENNFNVVYNLWKTEVLFKENIEDEQDLINLFLVDILNGTKYKKSFYSDEQSPLFNETSHQTVIASEAKQSTSVIASEAKQSTSVIANEVKQSTSVIANEAKQSTSVIANEVKQSITKVDCHADKSARNDTFCHADKSARNDTLYHADNLAYNDENNRNDIQVDLIREGTNLSKYKMVFDYVDEQKQIDGIKYTGLTQSLFYTVANRDRYNFFWKKYKRPPVKEEFLKILERSATLYSQKYRRDTGGEYTPTCFVEMQNEILTQHYNLDDFIVFDPCAGVGNLENQFGKDYKQYCYLSTLEQMDVDICKIKGFENATQFDYLKDDKEPLFKYKGSPCTIKEICQKENRKLMIVMNPPYQRKEGFTHNLAIEFFNKVVKLEPQVIVFYYMTESFLRKEVEQYIASGYKIVSHIFSNAKTTFLLSKWAISQIIFDKEKGEVIDKSAIKAKRYELENCDFINKGIYIYNESKPYLINEIDKKIRQNRNGMILGNVSYLEDVINLTNKISKNTNSITTHNILWCLLSKGINFNTNHKYFERNSFVYRGKIEEISDELFSDSIMFSLFYIRMAFTNKGQKNYIMPFTAEELGCAKNDLNVLFPDTTQQDLFSSTDEQEQPFDFREFLSQFTFSKEAKDLYNAALEIFKYYHANNDYQNKDYNDSFYDITNAIMGKDTSTFKELETQNDTRITKVKTTKSTKGFGKNTIKYAVASQYLPIFTHFFEVREILARKINKQLVESGLLLWERENIF